MEFREDVAFKRPTFHDIDTEPKYVFRKDFVDDNQVWIDRTHKVMLKEVRMKTGLESGYEIRELRGRVSSSDESTNATSPTIKRKDVIAKVRRFASRVIGKFRRK